MYQFNTKFHNPAISLSRTFNSKELTVKNKVHATFVILLAFLFLLPGPILAHDEEHQAKDVHGSSEIYEEGSGMKMHSGEQTEYKDRNIY